MDTQDKMDTWFLAKHPQFGPLVAVLYLIAVKYVLPKYMENRPAYKLKGIMRIYNIVQVYLNVQLVQLSFKPGVWSMFWDYHCNKPLDCTVPYYYNVANLGNMYVYVKMFDLLDTVFIVLKKKSSQLTFLHLFHHSAVVTVSVISFADKEQLGFPLLILNSFVHTIMYTYYMIASFESQRWVTKYKKFVTQLQIAQFILFLVFMMYALIRGCRWGRNSIIAWNVIIVVLLYKFCEFYYESYIKKKRK